jgi:HEAT repeat protein
MALRQVARGEGGAPQLIGAIGKALARAGEREILSLLLREAQSERPEEAIGAIGAIGDLGDPGAAPVLVRISQSAIASPGVRLAAVASLLRLDGPAHLPLLRVYLDSPIPPLRLRAHQILAQIDPASPQLIEPASDVGAPLALRLTAVESLLAQLPALSLAEAILKHADEPPQLRISIAGALGRSGSPGAAQTLREALGADGPPLLRRRCVEALGALADDTGDAGAAARAGLSALAQGADTPAELRHWADAIIVERALDRSTP